MTVQMTCANCGEPFYCYENEVERGRKYCSLKCRSAHRFKRDLPAASRTPVAFTCENCGKGFTMMQSYLTAYQKKFGHDPMYCSMACSTEGRRKTSEAKNTFTCENCGKTQSRRRKEGGRLYMEQKYCDHKCKVEAQMKAAHERFKSGAYGRHIKRNGYVWISVPALANGGVKREMLEHRYVMEQHLGRALQPGETIHHRDGDRQNNKIENLELHVSNHGPGQEIHDVIAWCIAMLRRYPDFAARAGVALIDVAAVDHQPITPPARSEPPAASG